MRMRGRAVCVPRSPQGPSLSRQHHRVWGLSVRKVWKNRGHGRIDSGASAPAEEARIAGDGGGDQGYVAYLLERLLYATAAHGTMELAEFRAMVRKDYASTKERTLPSSNEGR